MEIGMSIYAGVPVEKMVEGFKKIGVNRTFIMSDDKEFEKKMKCFSDNGIICETLHAPFDEINDMWGEDEDKGEAILSRLKDSVDKCAKYNIPVTIIHVSSGRPMPEISERGIKRYEELFNYAEKNGVKVALENLRYLENLEFLLNKYENTGFCWDDGHEYCYTPGCEYMNLFAKRLIALHIHDNTCGVDTDDHLLPFDGNIDMEKVAKNLAKSGYNGTLMLEIAKTVTRDGEEIYKDLSDEEYFKRALDAAQRLSDMVEKFR